VYAHLSALGVLLGLSALSARRVARLARAHYEWAFYVASVA
jgi:hypothetical protein